MKTAFNPELYLVTDRALSGGRPLEAIVAAALRGGATAVQLREKDATTREFIRLAERLLPVTRDHGAALIINDRVDVALAADADGVHVGQSDMPPDTVRRLVGPDKIVGLSVESPAQAEAARDFDVDYLGVSPIYTTPTKTDLQTALGIEGLRRIRADSRLPLVAIGGLNARTVPDVVRAGADGIAVVSAICAAPDPEQAARELVALIRRHKRGESP